MKDWFLLKVIKMLYWLPRLWMNATQYYFFLEKERQHYRKEIHKRKMKAG